MARVPRHPELRQLADRVYAAYRKRGQQPDAWLLGRYASSLSDDELRQLYLELLRRLNDDDEGAPPPQKERQRGAGGTER